MRGEHEYPVLSRSGPDIRTFSTCRGAQSIVDWPGERFVDLPRGPSRHEVRFIAREREIYVIGELPGGAARQDYEVLRALETKDVTTAIPVGIVEAISRYGRRTLGGHHHLPSGTRFFYQSCWQGHGFFGARREQMLRCLAGLLVELHLAAASGDCSLANVLYRYDAETIEPIMVDAETSVLRESLSDGQREEDLES